MVLCYRHLGDDRRVDNLGSVDDLLVKWNSKSNFRGGNTREMVILQGHLGSRLSNRLGADGTYREQRLYPGLLVFRQTVPGGSGRFLSRIFMMLVTGFTRCGLVC